MRKNEFKEFTIKDCIKSNIVSSVIFAGMLVGLYFISSLIIKAARYRAVVQGKDSGWSFLGVLILGILIIGLIMIIYSSLIPMFINIYPKFMDNLKSLILISAINIFFSYTVYRALGKKLSLIYAVFSLGGMVTVLLVRYNSIKNAKGE
ncbi:hypothetical protein [Clostridium polynesiense]|uniref:hypothetical protein n=1 Tax=Clostridium polynesiense TaxID=1325933 RepID=UPI00058C41EF|nr:hypothetical protein [Clostridium polynesiense]